ncbi:ferritin, partial [Klebsiella aerogenes]
MAVPGMVQKLNTQINLELRTRAQSSVTLMMQVFD